MISAAFGAPLFRRLPVPFALLLALLTAPYAPTASAAETDISSTPIVSTNAASAKPNIMLLMDTSDSMGYTHMPDEVESITLPTSVGYKSNQCNLLYYDPNQTYLLPKKSDGSFFATPSFTAARYAGFGDFYVVRNDVEVNLSNAFRAYDSSTLQIGGSADTAQPAYYYVLSGGATTLDLKAYPCRDADLGATRGASTGGTWTKVVVGSTSGVAPHVDERENFAIWYAYYRTRLALTKSAASLAFTPLTDSFRVGFITVQPKANRTDAGISAAKYLAISDFTSTQRSAWFAKLFSQTPFGSSPAREGLARVGRHYAGKFDSINTNMTPDPLQYSCQQNFTIMTTDGYWNNQTETPTTASLKGGALQLDGATQIGQADGDRACPLSDPYCPRPIWDGTAGTTEVVQDASNLYDQTNCGLSATFRSTFKTTQARHYFDASYEKTRRRTQTWTTTSDQDMARTSNVTRRSSRTTQTTEQFVESRYTESKTRYQVRKTVFQSTQTRTQKWEQSVQNRQSQYRVLRVDTAQNETSVQYQLVKSQVTRTTVQNFEEKRRYTIERRQVIKRQYRVVAKPDGAERYDPAASCTPGPTMSCQTIEVFPSAAVDTDTCTAGQDSNSPFVTTTCTTGPMATAPATTASCTPGTAKGGAPNHVTTICSDAQIQAPTARQTCTASTDASNVRTICTKPAGPNNEVTVGAASCTPNSGASSPFVITTCTYTAGANNATTYPNVCTVGITTDAQNVRSDCSRPPAANYSARQVSSCTPGTRTNNQVVTCSAVNTVFASAPVDPTTCTPADGVPRAVGNVTRTCTKQGTGTGLAYVGVQTCAQANSGSPNWVQTDCDQPSGTNYDKPIPVNTTCNSQTGNGGNDWRTITCNAPANGNNGTFGVAPGTCVANNGLSNPFVRVTCAGPTQIQSATLVLPSTCRPLGDTTGAAPDYYVTRCTRTDLDTTNTSCTVGNSGAPDYIEIECGSGTTVNAVSSCTVGSTGPSWNRVTCSKPAGPNNLTNDPVATCAPQTKASGNAWVERTCTTTPSFGPQVVHPTACTTGTATTSPFETTTCTTNFVAPYAVATPVASCTNGTDGAFTTTTCSKGLGYNPTPQASAPCTNGQVTTTGSPTHIRTTCAASDTVDYTAGRAACVAVDIPGRKVECTTFQSQAPQKVATCTPGTSGGAQPETTSCVRTQLATVDSAPCTSSIDTSTNESVVCTKVQLTTATLDTSCVASSLASAPWTITECTPGLTGGYKLRVTTTTTTTTSKKSGSVVVGTPNVVSNTASPVELTSCKLPIDPAVALPSPNPRRPVAPEGPPPPGSCTAWPCTDAVTADAGSQNSLADVASYYYKTDLRPDNVAWPNNVKPVGSGTEDDKAAHQHMTTFVVGLGVSGTLPFRNDYRSTAVTTGAFADLRRGDAKWPIWPDPAIDYGNTDNWNNPKSIDDFWHTAVNGRGTFFSAKDPATVVAGLDGALNAINITVASGAGDAASSFEPIRGNNTAYTTGYQTGSWTGDLKAFPINLTTGNLDTTQLWSANDLLGVRVKASCDTRNIYLIRPGGEITSGGGQNMVDFSWNTFACDGAGNPTGVARNGLGTAERLAFENGTLPAQLFSQYPAMSDGSSGSVDQRTLALGANLVNFVRGQTGSEDFAPNTARLYRKRAGVLGDFVSSQPIYVGAPFARYQDAGYGAFVLAQQSRTPMVYVGGNDGMLHAFVAATGAEAWAVVPQAVAGNLFKLADANYKNNHQFFVDGSPEVSDVFDGTNWRTILVGGLNAGGKSYYALDVTDPAAPKALWEFRAFPGSQCPATAGAAAGNTSDCNLGLTFGKPVVTKLGARWVVLVTSGYNNINSASNGGDGGGYLYAIDAVTGALVHKTDTGAGSATDPSGLAQIRNFVDNTLVDNVTLRAYGGDLLGNVWRFEFPNPGTPSAQLIGTAKDASNRRQPITTRPELAESGTTPMVFVGTGKLLGSTDVTDRSTQSIYGIVDPLTSGPVHADLRGALKPLVMTQVGTGPTAVRTVACPSSAGSACNRTTGWVMDLPESGERVNVDMKLLFGVLIVPSNVPEAASCTVGGHSWFNYFDYKTGTQATGVPLANYFGETLIAGFNVFKMPAPDNQQGFRVVGVGSDGRRQSDAPIYPPPVPSGKRIAWREIVR